MKKMIFALALLPSLLMAAPKYGVVDLMILVRNHADYDRNKKLLETTNKDYTTQIDAIKAEGETLQAEGKKLAEQFRNPMLSDKAKVDIEKKMTDLQQKLIAIEQRYRSKAMTTRQELQDLETRMLKATTEDLRKRIASFAESNAYDMILDKSAVPYAKDAYDVTDEVLKAMGVNPAQAKGRNESK